jgi:hypothetical protein
MKGIVMYVSMSKGFVLGLLAVLVLGTTGAMRADLMDSANFALKYEMDALPTTQDLLGRGNTDFAPYGSGTIAAAGGILNLNSTEGDGNAALEGDGAAAIWPNSGITGATGYTIEFKAKVLSSSGAQGAVRLATIAPSAGASNGAWLTLNTTDVTWGTLDAVLATALDNSSDYHVYRVSSAAGSASFNVWRDGVALGTGLTSNVPWSFTMFDFGDSSGNLGGNVNIDYLRFTPGAYAPVPPVPEPGCIVLLSTGLLSLLAYAWRKRR